MKKKRTPNIYSLQMYHHLRGTFVAWPKIYGFIVRKYNFSVGLNSWMCLNQQFSIWVWHDAHKQKRTELYGRGRQERAVNAYTIQMCAKSMHEVIFFVFSFFPDFVWPCIYKYGTFINLSQCGMCFVYSFILTAIVNCATEYTTVCWRSQSLRRR